MNAAMPYVPMRSHTTILEPRDSPIQRPYQQDVCDRIILHVLTASFKDQTMTLPVEDDDDCQSHGFCEMLMDKLQNRSIEKAKRIWDIYPTANQRNYYLLPVGMTLRPEGMRQAHQATVRIRYQSGGRSP